MNGLLVRVKLYVAQGAKATKLLVDVGEAVGEGEQVRADDDLQLDVREEESAVTHLMAERLVGVVIADGLKVRGGVKVRREGSGKVEGKEMAVGVPGAEIPYDALSSGEETLLTDNDGGQLTSKAGGELIAPTQVFKGVYDDANGTRELANGAGEENLPE